MKKIALLAFLLVLSLPLRAFFPFFHGARSLALGYSSLAFNYDANALYLNPALLATLAVPLGGYQYADSRLDFRDAAGGLAAARAFDLENFAGLAAADREAALAALRGAFAAGAVISGFRSRGPAYAGKGYAVAVTTVDAAVVAPLSGAVLDRPDAEVSGADVASLRVRFTGLRYTDYSLAVAFPLSQGVCIGAALHYLKGKGSAIDAPLAHEAFSPQADAGDLVESAWSAAENSFSRVTFDLGAALDIGPHFKAGVTLKNAGSPAIDTAAGPLPLARRVVAGLAFRPDAQLAILLDVDIAPGELFPGGGKAQPLALGVEKGLFRNKLLLRAGLWSDLETKYLLGRRANALYGLGLGFNLGRFLVDMALGLDSQGRVKNLGVSGFYALR